MILTKRHALCTKNMKNIKLSLFLALFLLPSVGFAQTVNEQYISALQQVLQLLIQEVSLLEQQLATLQQGVSSGTIQATSTPQIFGSLPVNQPIMDSSISILVNGQNETTINSGDNVTITWDGKDSQACGIVFDTKQGGWAGNFGLIGTKRAGPFTKTTIVTLQCGGNNLATSTILVK